MVSFLSFFLRGVLRGLMLRLALLLHGRWGVRRLMLIEAMRGVSNFTSLEDKRAEAMLRTQVVEGLKAYEFALRRSNGDDASNRVLLERTGDVPPAFKALVEEYYRSLSRTPKKP